MNREAVDRIARALLYEGYLLYPYRPSVKNRHRWTFGGLAPEAWSAPGGGRSEGVKGPGVDPCSLQAECLLAAGPGAALEVELRFLQVVRRTLEGPAASGSESYAGGRPETSPVDPSWSGEAIPRSWQEARERRVALDPAPLRDLAERSRSEPFAFAPDVERDESGGANVLRESDSLQGAVELSALARAEGLYQVTVRARNTTAVLGPPPARRDEAVLRSFISTHLVLGASDGEFVSLLDPPPAWRDLAAGCRNSGVFPVLVGSGSEKDTMLASPIILYDYPQVAPESPGDLFDATEIDEILTLRILTLTGEEKRLMAAVDARARALLERTESLGAESVLGLHGALRGLRTVSPGHSGESTP